VIFNLWITNGSRTLIAHLLASEVRKQKKTTSPYQLLENAILQENANTH